VAAFPAHLGGIGCNQRHDAVGGGLAGDVH
jgi:hypothetical protein